MKKHLLYLCMASLLGLASCEDFNEHNFKGLEDMTTPENVLNKDYTLTADDYTTISGLKVDGIESSDLKAVKSNQYLTPQSNPRTVLPAFLAKNWKTASLGATLRMTFNYVPEAPAYLSTLEAAGTYELTEEDYKTIWEKEKIAYLTPAKSPEKNLPLILAGAVTDPVKGAYTVAAYRYSESEPEEGGNAGQPVVLLSEAFAEGQGNFTIENPVLPTELSYVWKADTRNGYMKASARKDNVNYAAESWLVSPSLNMSEIATAVLTFDHISRFGEADHSDVTLWVSTDYVNGAPATGQWVQVPIPVYSSGSDWNFVESGEIVLDGFAGNANVHIAFRYTSTGSKAATWEVKNVVINAVTGSGSGDVTYEEGEAFAESFAGGQGGFTIDNKIIPTELSYVWKADTRNGYMKASARKDNVNYAAESWLVSPAISLAGVKEPELTFDHVTRFSDQLSTDLTLWISADGGDFVQLTIPAYSSGSDWTFVNSGAIDLKPYAGKSVKIAFKYLSSSTVAPTWEVKNISITGLIASSRAATIETRAAVVSRVETRYAVYTYNGTAWEQAEKVTIVNPADYEEMGAPGKGYFTSSAPAANYLPQFLGLKYPYAQEADTVSVMYNYSNLTTLKADEYVFANGVWKSNTQPVTVVTEQYALSDAGWVYSPDVTITLIPGKNMGTKHFQALTDWVWENIDQKEGVTEKGKGYVTSYGNNDYYYGGSEYQNNFDFRPSSWKAQNEKAYSEMSDEELNELMWKRLPEGIQHMLEVSYPEAQLEDVPITYVVNFGVYGAEGSSGTKYYTIRYKLTGKGQFAYIKESLKEISSL